MTGATTAAGCSLADFTISHEIYEFLNYEADLLDSWQLQDWLGLLTEDCRYLIPATDAVDSNSPERSIFIIADSYPQIVGRVRRLESDSAFVEQPRSRTRHLITNIRVQIAGRNEYVVRSNFAVYRFRRGTSDVFVGGYRHVLVRARDGSFRIKERRAVLDCEELRPQGKVSFIL